MAPTLWYTFKTECSCFCCLSLLELENILGNVTDIVLEYALCSTWYFNINKNDAKRHGIVIYVFICSDILFFSHQTFFIKHIFLDQRADIYPYFFSCETHICMVNNYFHSLNMYGNLFTKDWAPCLKRLWSPLPWWYSKAVCTQSWVIWSREPCMSRRLD